MTVAARAANVVEGDADRRVGIAALHRQIKIAPLQKLPHLRLGKAGYRRSCSGWKTNWTPALWNIARVCTENLNPNVVVMKPTEDRV